LALASVFVAGCLLFSSEPSLQPVLADLPAVALLAEAWKRVDANWIVLALALSLLSVKLSRRFVHGGT
jgi:hypothetical protein